ncbi:MAG: hypothetical protein Ta2A_02720 [Treponemataceae bacterium]|nr:MAG: hypothetical protein Ta2A_02720 [Treponemataceae bacterium]
MGWNIFRRKAVKLRVATLLCIALLPMTARFGSQSPAQLNAQTHAQSPAQAQNTPQPVHRGIGIAVPNHRLITKYHNEFLSTYGIKLLYNVLDSGAIYRVYIRKKLREYNMPACLEYLPVIESYYNPGAVSRTGAGGLWQFSLNSIQPYLAKNQYIDERFDPWRSTDAALVKLYENYKTFGDWTLALAAYNMGAGALQRVIKSAPNKNYWALVDSGLIKKETMEYVPKFLAIADLIMNAHYYKINLPEITARDDIPFVYVPSPAGFNVRRFCARIGLDQFIFNFLNPSLLSEITPPNLAYRLRLPPVFQNAAVQYIASEGGSDSGTGFAAVTVKKGDTIWSIAKAYGISVSDFCAINGLSENAVLTIGSVLYVPINK